MGLVSPLLTSAFSLSANAISHDPIERAVSKNPRVRWSDLQYLFLNDCDADVLFLLDCCFAGSSVLRCSGNSTLEAIFASGFHSQAPIAFKHSFTTFLTNALREARCKEEPIYAETLCRKIAAAMNQNLRQPDMGHGHSVTPHHITFSNIPSSIVLSAAKAPKDSQSTRFYATAATSCPGIPGPPTSVNQPNGKGTKPIRPQTERRFSISSWKIFGRSSSRHRDEV